MLVGQLIRGALATTIPLFVNARIPAVWSVRTIVTVVMGMRSYLAQVLERRGGWIETRIKELEL
jgi:hypothetical protein